jgi:hypothetical protein
MRSGYLALLVSCLAAGPACGGPSLPRLLTSTVHRTEEQGIDYSSTGTWNLEIALDGDVGLATSSVHATDVAGSDVHEVLDQTSYDVRASRDARAMRLALTPRAGSPPTAEAVTLECTPWTDTERTIESFEAPPEAGGVAWACALPEGHTFALGRIAIEHLPREGRAFVLFSETSEIVIEETVSQSSRTVHLRVGPPRRP